MMRWVVWVWTDECIYKMSSRTYWPQQIRQEWQPPREDSHDCSRDPRPRKLLLWPELVNDNPSLVSFIRLPCKNSTPGTIYYSSPATTAVTNIWCWGTQLSCQNPQLHKHLAENELCLGGFLLDESSQFLQMRTANAPSDVFQWVVRFRILISLPYRWKYAL